MGTFEQQLEQYAELTIKIGINIQKGQKLFIQAPISAARMVRALVKKAYQSGARVVNVDWSDEELERIKFQEAPDAALREFPKWKAKGMEDMSEEGTAFLTIHVPNPDLLKDIDPGKIAIANKTSSEALKKARDYRLKDKVSWTIISVSTKDWAVKVFPKLDAEEAVKKLWQVIFQMTRVNQSDPIAAWRTHQQQLRQRLVFLNQKKYKKLHYQAPGTDLSIALPEDHVWLGGGSRNAKGIDFIPNVPTEEVFTLPLRTGVNGTVSSTKPLNYGGNVIEQFSITFKNGRIVGFDAQSGVETLKHLIDTDEGSHFLGEVALVPHDSPISKSNLIFYNTLFDENASCHVAIGAAYPFCLKNGTNMSQKELEAHDVNTSLAHVDFMIGSAKLDIDGETKGGIREPLFRNGNWV